MPRVRRAKGGGLVISMDPEEALVLQALPARLREVLDRRDFKDRIVQRLFPCAHRDPQREAEHRKLLGDELLQRKLDGIRAFESTLSSPKVKGRRVEVAVEAGQFDLWLGFVNDMRLLLATELDIDEDFWKQPLEPSDPRAPEMALLHYLSWLEEELLRA